ncbi:MAG: hypothetical protein U9P10_01085 [Thermodesulfobacteriota bacterium]|nr:hypothetical protein [Thermodesulfobacteriota bacterium]
MDNHNTNQDDQYDSPWKEGIELYFREFMEFYFPEIAVEIVWDKEFEFLDKELQSVVRDAEIGRRHADKLVKVWSLDGTAFHVMIHIEVQGDKDLNFARRMYIYNYRIFDKRYLPVTSLAILADENETWRPESYNVEQWGCKINFTFPMVKLHDYNNNIKSLLKQTNPFAIITAAHLKTKATKGNHQLRYSWRWTITTALYERGFSKQDILNIYRLIDWLMMLPEELTKRFTEDLINYEEKKKMPYIMSAERLGMEKGLEKGQLSEAKEMLLKALDTKFSKKVPEDVYKTINIVNNRLLLKDLLGSAILSKDLDNFRKILQEIPPEQMQKQ